MPRFSISAYRYPESVIKCLSFTSPFLAISKCYFLYPLPNI